MRRAVVVGCGPRGMDHIEAYRHIAAARVTACCDPHPEKREAATLRFGLRSYEDAATMISAESPDLVHLATGPSTRVGLLSLVDQLGVPLCTTEKPVCTSVPDWRALSRLAQGQRTRFAVCHQLRWHQDLMRCQQAMARLGSPELLHLSAGMNLMGQGTHVLNYGRSLIGDPRVTEVFGTVSGWDADDRMHPAPRASVAQLVFANGVRGLWTSGPTSPRCGDPATTWQHVRVAAQAASGRVIYEEFARWETSGPDGVAAGRVGDHRAGNLLAQAGFHTAMLDWLDGADRPGSDLAASLHECAVIFALYTSALHGRPVTMDGFDPADDLVEQVRGRFS